MCLFFRRICLIIFTACWISLIPFHPAYAQNSSAIATDEAAAIHRLVEISKQMQEPGLRGQHPKGHGTVWAEFTIAPDLPENLRVGIFQEPGRTFPAWIRFSNARGKDDMKAGLQGMAIKLMDVEGQKLLDGEKNEKTQDFVLVNHPTFFIRNVQDFTHFFEAVAQSPGKPPLKFFFPGLNPTHWHGRELLTQLTLKRIKNTSPIDNQYWSTTPYQFGSEVVKYAVKPAAINHADRPTTKTEDYLRTALVEHLQQKEAVFDFLVQLQNDPIKQPIDDAIVEWREKDAPLQKVATIRIPRQVFDTPEQKAFGEALSFTPWHTLPEHQPLGSINLARKEVYRSISKQRHDQTAMTVKEPLLDTFRPNLLD